MLEKIIGFFKYPHIEHDFKFVEVLETKIFEDQGREYKQSRELLRCSCGKETILDVVRELK